MMLASLARGYAQRIYGGGLILAVCFLLGGAHMAVRSGISARHFARIPALQDPGIYECRGRVKGEVRKYGSAQVCVLSVQEVRTGREAYSCEGEVTLRITGGEALFSGDSLEMRLSLPARPCRRAVPGFCAQVRGYDILSRRPATGFAQVPRMMASLRVLLSQVLQKYLPSLHAGIAAAMVLGVKEGVPDPVFQMLVRCGGVHVLVVSGFNTGVVAWLVLGAGKLVQLSRSRRLVLAAVCVIAYCALTGAAAPVTRATVMTCLALLAAACQRTPDMLHAAGIAATAMLVADPRQAQDASFQLSFASVVTLIAGYPRVYSWMRVSRYPGRIMRGIGAGLAASLTAWFGTALPVAWHCRVIAPSGILANIVIVPLATAVTVSGAALIVCGLWLPPAAWPCAYLCRLSISALLAAAHLASKMPGACFFLPRGCG